MATTTARRYGKPSLTNLPYELGKSIIDQIMSTPKPDFTEMRKRANEVEEKILEARADNAQQVKARL